MDNGKDYDLVILNPKVDSKRKPTNQGTASTSMDHGINARIF